jgi:multiple sugar transport system permease protein
MRHKAQAGKSALKAKEARLGYLLIAPTVLLIAVVIIYPVFYNLWLSFHQVTLNPFKSDIFIGFGNYTHILTDPEFWDSFRLSVIYTAATVVGATIAGLGAALLLNRKFKGRGLVRGVMLLPYVAPIISLVFVWQYLFHPEYGMVNYVLVDLLGVLSHKVDWVDSSQHALWMVIFFDIWHLFPFAFLMILAKLQSIPDSLYEAAEVDGAGPWKKFWHITLPELQFILGSLVILRWIWNFNKFDEIYLLTTQVNVVPVYAYETAFRSFQHGLAASITATLFVFSMILVLFTLKKVLKW